MGDVVISIDGELGWGHHDLPVSPMRIDRSRSGWETALELLDEYDVPATWAIVGHLFLEECDGRHEAHPLGPEWFSCRPGSTANLWRAPELVRRIQDADQPHEIASHTFSHIVCSEVSQEVAEAELAASTEIADCFGITLETLVYPRNQVAHRDVLADAGFSGYRGRVKPWYQGSRFRSALKLVDWSPLGTAPPIVSPTVDEYGLVDVPASLYLYGFQGRARSLGAQLGIDPVVSVVRRGLERVAERDGVFHLWLHPHNLLQPGGRERFEAVLANVDRHRAASNVSTRTMAGVLTDANG